MRDGRRKRLGLGGSITATYNPGEDPGNTNTSGIGSLISISDLYDNALAGENATTGNQAYLDRILNEAGPQTLNLDPGAYVDTRDNRYINDAYNYYLGGGTGNFADEVAIDTPATTDLDEITADGGNGGQATGGLGTGEIGTGDLDGLTQSGTFAGNPTFTTTPGTTVDDITGDITNADGTYAGNIVDEVALTGGLTQSGTFAGNPTDTINPGTTVDDITGDITNADGTYAGNIVDEVALTGVTTPSSFDYETEAYGTVNEVTEDPTMQETISNAFTSARQNIGDLATASVDKIQEVGQSIANTIGGVYNGVDQTISVFGKEINVPTTLAGIALNQVVGAPISLVFGALKAIGGMLPKDSLENSTKRSIAAQLTAENNYGYNMQSGNIGQDPFGRNPVSAFGNYEQALAEDLAYVGDSNFKNAKKQYAEDYFNAKAEVAGGVEQTSGISEVAGGTGIVSTGDVLGPGEFLPEGEDLVSLEDQLAEQAAAEQAQAAKIEAERRELQEINARAEREAADAQAAANAAAQAAAIEAQRRALQNINAGGGGGGARSGGSSSGNTSSTNSSMGNLGFSDIRLKDNVELIGKSPSNINIYKFNYKGNPTIYQGAMAHEVSWASVKANNGYLMIDYDKIDVEFKPYAK